MSEKIGVFIFAFGAPRSLDRAELADFLEKITGRKPAEEAVSGLLRRYETIGGLSPLVETGRAQATALEAKLAAENISSKVYFGVRYGKPSIRDAIMMAIEEGVTGAVALTHAPQFVGEIAQAYRKAATDVLEQVGALEITFTDSYGAHPDFIDAVCARLFELFDSDAGSSPQKSPIIFTAHSLPADSTGVSKYVDELEESARMVVEKLQLGEHYLAFQSRGRGRAEWLEPSLEQVLERLAGLGHKEISVCPLGFVAENLETLYDLDIAAARHARSLGLDFHRSKTPGDSDHLIKAWADIVMSKPGAAA